ncbi:ferritin-like domain-containing protein, partial [Streptomyces clavuligerus]
MSVFDLPRLHFRGTAVVRLPTGPRSGLVDLATNTALTGDGRAFPAHRPAAEYHDSLDRLDRLDPRDRLGPGPGGAVRPAAAGPHSADTRSPATRSAATRSTTRGEDLSAKGEDFSGKGEDFSGNGHFSVDARIVSAESAAGDFDTADPVVGRRVDLWGHYNEYLATTVNRARVFDVDPASDWTTTLMVGRFCFGRAGRSHDVGYMATGDVHGFHPPRWHHPSAHGRRRSALHQFVVGGGDEGLTWLDETALSPAARRLRDTAAAGEFGGLVVQFALGHPSAPRAPGRPGRWLLRGTIAPWRPDEPRTYPAGRLLVPERPHTAHTAHATAAGRTAGLRPLTVGLTDDHVTLNMITAVPATVRAADGTTAEAALPGPAAEAALPVPVDLGDLELRTADSGRLVARVPRQAYTGAAYALASGVVTVPAELPASAVAEEALCLTGTGSGPYAPGTLLREKEINVQVDDASLILEHPRGPDDADHDVEVLVRSFVRGRPAAVGGIGVRQFFNPRALPRHPAARNPKARCADLDIVRLRAGRRDGTGTGSGDGSGNGDGAWSSACVLDTDRTGQGWFTLRGAAAGTARVLLSADAGDLPCDPDQPGSAALGYDHDDALGFWPGAGHLSLRVLPDDWRLSGTTPDEATFDLVHREVLACYEQLYSFMKEEVFSLADRCKVETYAKLIWQMCDPRNKAKTFYMPPTRDLSEPKARLLLTYLRARQSPERLVLTAPAEGGGRAGARARGGGADSRGRLVRLLRDAATLELAVMLQYLYAAYSVPVYGAGREYVRRGLWTPGQLRLACGDGGETLDEGIRGMLLTVAREEMVHFLLVGNILTAVGEPFAVPLVDFGTVNHELPLPLDLALERLGPGSVERFALIERPDDLVGEVRTSGMTGTEGM